MRELLEKFKKVDYFTVLKVCLPALMLVFTGSLFAQEIKKTQFQNLVQQVFQQPYKDLPQFKVSKRRFGKKGDNPKNQLFNAAKRTLSDERSWLPSATEPKLFNANGICFSGKWVIDTASAYTGLFAQNTRANILARASVALSGTKQKHKRAYGMAVKIFDKNNEESSNLFVMHSLAGIKTRQVMDLELDNHPELGKLPSFSKIPILLRISKDLKRADRMTGTNSPELNYRSVDSLARLNNNSTQVVSPTWVKIVPETLHRENQNDFRDEMSIERYPNKRIEYTLHVASGHKKDKDKAVWTKLGLLILEESVASRACDINLHFPHPKNNSAN